PRAVLPGRTVQLLVGASPLSGYEIGVTSDFTATVDHGATVLNPTWSDRLGVIHSTVFHVVEVRIPDNATEGTQLHIVVDRSTTIPSAVSQHSDIWTVTVGSALVVASITPDIASGQPGSTIQAVLGVEATVGAN